MIESGQLSVAIETPVYSDVIVAGTSDVEVLRVKFDAADDEIHVGDLWLINDIPVFDGTPDTGVEGRLDFKLYSASGQLLQTKQMVGGVIHFELANQDRIRVPKDDVTFVVVKVDARAINEANQTGKRLNLRLGNFVTGADNDPDVEANTAATGSDLSDANISGSADGEDFVLYKTNISVKHSATQPSVSIPSASALTEVYRFTVSADAAGAVDLARVSFIVNLNGIEFDGANTAFQARPVVNGSVDQNATFPVAVTDTTDGDAIVEVDETSATVQVDLRGQRISAGGSLTFALFAPSTEEDADGSENSDGLTVEILNDTAYATPDSLDADENGTAHEAGDQDGNIVWSDESGSPHGVTSLDWLNGFEVDVDVTPKRLTK